MPDQETGPTFIFEDFKVDPVRKLVTRMPDGETLALTNKAFQVLLHLIENRGHVVTKTDLMSRVWDDSFVEEGNLTQTISVLRKALGEKPSQHRFIVTESGRGYRFVAPVVESNGSAFVSDASSTNDSGSSEVSLFTASWGKNSYAVFGLGAGLILLLIGAFVFLSRDDARSAEATTGAEVKSIAVLPFLGVQPDDDVKLIGIGMADAVISRLSHIGSISVRQTSSVMRYADATPEAVRIGREINVDAILEGSIQRADSRIRVSVRLFRVADGSLIWAEVFDEADTDTFALQDSIAEKVANSLSLKLDPDERDKLRQRHTTSIEAYNLYQKGRYFWNNRNGKDLRKSIELFEQAIALDGNYALAYAGIADSYVLLQFFSHTERNDFFPRAKAAAEKALELDPDLAEPHAALALYEQLYEWDWVGAEREFQLAIAANPSYPTAHQWYGEFLSSLGRFDESIVEVEKAVELDPLSLSTNTARAVPYLASGRFSEAIEKLKPALDLDGGFSLALLYLGRAYAGLGDHKEAIVQYRKSVDRPGGGGPYFTTALINSYSRDGQKEEAERQLAGLLRLAEKIPISNYVLARGFAPLGYREEALAKLEKALEERDGLLIILKTDKNFDDLREDYRFRQVLTRMNLDD